MSRPAGGDLSFGRYLRRLLRVTPPQTWGWPQAMATALFLAIMVYWTVRASLEPGGWGDPMLLVLFWLVGLALFGGRWIIRLRHRSSG